MPKRAGEARGFPQNSRNSWKRSTTLLAGGWMDGYGIYAGCSTELPCMGSGGRAWDRCLCSCLLSAVPAADTTERSERLSSELCRATLLWESPSMQGNPQAGEQNHCFVVRTRMRVAASTTHGTILLCCRHLQPSAPALFQRVPHFVAKLFPTAVGVL